MFKPNKIAATIAFAYAVIVLRGVLLLWAGGNVYTLEASLSRPSLWIAIIVSLAVAWGLWQRFRWAWWLGVVAGMGGLVNQLVYIANDSDYPAGVLIVLGIFVAFTIAMVAPRTRFVCSR